MTPTYEDYRKALSVVRELPAVTAADLVRAGQTKQQATALADKAVANAQSAIAEAAKAIEFHLASARSALEPVGRSNLIPLQIRPSGGPKGATRDDIATAQQALAVGVNTLRTAVASELKRAETERERLAREVAERERLAREAAAAAEAARARRRRLTQIVAAALVITVVLILILVLAL